MSSPRANPAAGIADAEALALFASVAEHLRRNEISQADGVLARAAILAPDHPERARLAGVLVHLRGDPRRAAEMLAAAHERWPDDASILNNFGGALRDSGAIDMAIEALRNACELDPEAAAHWYNLGVTLMGRKRYDEAAAALARSLERRPDHRAAQLARADSLARAGRTAQAAEQYRAILARDPHAVPAWTGLASSGAALSEPEISALRETATRAANDDAARSSATFALAYALEARGQYDAAYAAFGDANAARGRVSRWNGEEFSQLVDKAIDVFASARARAGDDTLGGDIVFVTGFPNRGVERLLAMLESHADISLGDGEPDLVHVLQEESTRRGVAYPAWVGDADASDWKRLGERYLARIARWRRDGAINVDIASGTWPFLGAALAMLPGARIVDARDDATEACWHAYRRLYPRQREAYSYDFADLARHWNDYDRTMLFWHARHGARIHTSDAARLIAEPAKTLAGLFAFAGLADESECANADVRSTLAPTSAYGARLDPLRRLLDPFAR
jgi:tetratricopeptide (TPR) repeat protein